MDGDIVQRQGRKMGMGIRKVRKLLGYVTAAVVIVGLAGGMVGERGMAMGVEAKQVVIKNVKGYENVKEVPEYVSTEKWWNQEVKGEKVEKIRFTLEDVYQELQGCSITKTLNAASDSHDSHSSADSHSPSTYMTKLSRYLFPFGPAGNSLLATAYISGPPNFLLALVPPDIDPSRLSIMVAFAVGGLLGDTLLHLIPGSFLGDHEGKEVVEGAVRFAINSEKRNLLVGTMVMVGFGVFVAMEKALRVASMGKGGGGGHGHSHSHSHSHSHAGGGGKASGTGRDSSSNGELRKRKGEEVVVKKEGDGGEEEKEKKQEVKISSYLNIIADFSHNITDGLAMSAAFYTSPTLGLTTTISVFFHEIPHEVGDFALLVQSGFTKWQAMGAQFFTAIGAFLGTFIGIGIQWWGGSQDAAGVEWNGGIWGSGMGPGDLVLPFTAGTFLYVGFSAVPELLEVSEEEDEKGGKWREAWRGVCQLLAMAAGFAIMLLVS